MLKGKKTSLDRVKSHTDLDAIGRTSSQTGDVNGGSQSSRTAHDVVQLRVPELYRISQYCSGWEQKHVCPLPATAFASSQAEKTVSLHFTKDANHTRFFSEEEAC